MTIPDEPTFGNIFLLNGLIKSIPATEIPIVISLGVGLLLCLGLSAFCAASENAFFSHKENDILKLHNTKSAYAKIILYILNMPKHLLATVLVLNSFGMIMFVILAEVFFEKIFEFEHYKGLKFFIDAILVTLVILIFGEVMPKVYGTHNYIKTSKFFAYPMRAAIALLWPITTVLVKSTQWFEKNIKPKTQELTPEELSHVIDITADKNDITKEKEILKGIVHIGQIEVSQIMRPRMEVVCLDKQYSFNKVLEIIKSNGFSRMPVFENNLDEIVGMINIKDILPHAEKLDNYDWTKLMRSAFFVPHNKKIDDLLHEFRQSRNHLAIVVDEYGGTSGIVTLEDILEEVFGEMYDEFDEENISYSQLSENEYLFEGKVLIVDFLRIANLPVSFFDDIEHSSETLGGLLTDIHNNIPKKGTKINIHNLTFIIDASENKGIRRVKTIIGKSEN